MVITKTGKTIEDLFMLGHPAIPIYLLDGDRPAIFDADLSCLGEIYTAEIKKVLGRRKPAYCFLTHSHFDHCGAVSVLKNNFSSMQIISSGKARKILVRPNAIALIRELNHSAELSLNELGIEFRTSANFEPFEIDNTIGNGEVIQLAKDLTVCAYETPGHTWDCLSYFIPEKKVLFSSEAAGQPDLTGYIFSECLAACDEYHQSIKLLSRLNSDVICLVHIFVYPGQDSRKFLRDSIAEYGRFRKLVENSLIEENWDMDRVKKRIRAFEYDSNPGPKQIESANLLNLEARIKAVQNHMDKTPNSTRQIQKTH